jgi:prepilin-type N-terminal cleavage/methylation domain-containing protein
MKYDILVIQRIKQYNSFKYTMNKTGDYSLLAFILQKKINKHKIKFWQACANDGFTTIELIAVLVILGVLAVVMVQRMGSNSSQLTAVYASLKSHIRYAHGTGMQSDTLIRGIRFNSDLDEYWLFTCPMGQTCNWTDNRSLPPGGEASQTMVDQNRLQTSLVNVNISQIRVGAGSQPQLTVVYNDMGVPFWIDNTAVTFQSPLSDTTGLNRLTHDITITLADSQGNQKTITIQAETGFVQ